MEKLLTTFVQREGSYILHQFYLPFSEFLLQTFSRLRREEKDRLQLEMMTIIIMMMRNMTSGVENMTSILKKLKKLLRQ